MHYDLVPIKGKYRGMGRSLLGTDLLNETSRNIFGLLLEEYYSFLEYSQSQDRTSFEKMVVFGKILEEFDILYEIIVYDKKILTDAFGYPVELLGIDIVHDMCESLIAEGVNPQIIHVLNENGLCNTIEDVKRIILYQNSGEVEWEPCYVYKVIFEPQ